MCEESKYSWMCRVCLDTKQNSIKSINESYKEYCIMEYINKLTKLNIQTNDGFPDKICSNCFIELESALSFIEKCKKSDSLLKSYCKSSYNISVKIEQDINDSEIKSEENTRNYELLDEPLNEDCVSTDFLIEAPNSRNYGLPDEPLNEDCVSTDLLIEAPETIKKSISAKFECHDCGGMFKSKCKIRVHWKNTHMLSSLICTHCKRSFKSYKAYNLHIKNNSRPCRIARDKNVKIEGVGKSREFFCVECSYKTKRIKDMDAHLRTHSGEKPYQCNMCPNRYSQMGSLQTHKETFHKKYLVQITCQFCGKHVKGRGKVYRHLKAHKEGKIQCPVCNKAVSKRNLSLHVRRHTGVKTYTCETCAATFYTSGELCNHKRWVHKKTDVYKCELCDFKTLKRHLVRRHQKRHTDKNIPCTVCGMFFLTAQKLTVHQRRHFDEKNFICPQCNKKFLTRDSVRKHMVNKHLSIVDQKNIMSKYDFHVTKPENIIIDIPKTSPLL